MQIKFILSAPANPPSLIRKLAGLVVMVAVLAVALMFSAVLLVVIAVWASLPGLICGGRHVTCASSFALFKRRRGHAQNLQATMQYLKVK